MGFSFLSKGKNRSLAERRTSMHNVLSYHVLTDRFRELIERQAGEQIRYVPVAKLRGLDLRSLFAEIRRLKADRITVAIENEDARPLAGPLTVLAGLSGTADIRILWPERKLERIPRFRILPLLGAIMGTQCKARIGRALALRRLQKLAGAARPTIREHKRSGRIIYLDANLSFGVGAGGSVGHIRGVIDWLAEAGFEVDYASVRALVSNSPRVRWLRIKAPALYAFPPELNYYSFNRDYERQLRQLGSKRNYDFIYQRMSLHNFSGAWLRGKLGIPLVLEYNGSETWVAAHWGERLKLHDDAVAAERASLDAADLVVTVSKVLADEVAAAGVPRERIVTYPNCIDPAIFDPARFSDADNAAVRKRLGIGADAKVATFIGTFGMWHGVDFLARAARRLILEDRDWVASRNLHFLLVGDGLKMPNVRELLCGAPFDEFVTLTGLVPQSEAPAYLAASDIFLSPHVPNPDGSAFFGSPTKLFEYMAMEKPIVASDLDQIGAVLKEAYLDDAPALKGPLGELFTPGDEQGFLEAFRKVVDHPKPSSAMATRAREAVLRSYTWERHVGAIIERMKLLNLMP